MYRRSSARARLLHSHRVINLPVPVDLDIKIYYCNMLYYNLYR